MQLQEAHRHQQLNGQKSQGLQTRLSRCFFLTRDQDRWTFQLSTRVRTLGSSELEEEQSGATQWIHAKTVGVRFDSSCEDDIEGAEHRGCCMRNAHCDSESHRQEVVQVENNDRYLRQMGDFQTMSDELTDAKGQLRMASSAERDDPDERSKHGAPRQQDLTQQQPPTESPPQKQHVPPQSSSQPLKQQSRKDPQQQQFHPQQLPRQKQRVRIQEDSPTVDDGRGK